MEHASVATRWSVVLAAGGSDPAAREAVTWLCRQYWTPLCAHIRRRGWRDDQELAQDFLTNLIERDGLRLADPNRGRFRAWLFTCLDHFLANTAAAAMAAKRGGGIAHEVLDEIPGGDQDPAIAFDHDWAIEVLHQAEERLAITCADKARYATLRPFLAQEGDAAAYRVAAESLGLSELAIKVAVHRLRERYREMIRAAIAETLAETDPGTIDAELDCLIRALGRTRM